jgi:eukaryotic-like serine/threonine-protein kinase
MAIREHNPMAASPDVKSVFGKALELEAPADRAAYLDQACGGDAALRGQVEGLLAALGKAGRFMSHPAVAPPDLAVPRRDEAVGTAIGPYKLLQKLGEGGMGAVYLAEQDQPVKRRVALKLIKAGLSSPQTVARFEHERQTLALMDHPNIAQVLDAGTTGASPPTRSISDGAEDTGGLRLAEGETEADGGELGRSYVVMELVKGVPITQYCDQERLTPRERLELFVPVCQAVQHAHQKGIIHRDLKPSNVLIAQYDGRPVPKVIDFGVAKAVDPTLSERTRLTEVGVLVGTLEYMAPEQAELNNLDIDTRADIYSLGIILYELLTGSPPFTSRQLRDAGLAEMLRLVKEVEPPRPSTRLSSSVELSLIAASRRVEPRTLTREITGELDWIVMKCLEKDRSRRYETADALASDIRRYLADEPVSAGPPSAGYRLKKFMRRNRRALAATATFVLLLVTAVVTLTVALVAVNRERREKETALDAADRRQQQTRAAHDAMTSDVIIDALAMQPALLPEHKEFLEAALRQYEDFAADTGQEEEARARVAHAYSRVGSIRKRLGQWADAEAAWERGRELYTALATDYPHVPVYPQAVAEIHLNRGVLYRHIGRLREAEEEFGRALTIHEQQAADSPDARRNLALTHSYLGIVLERTRRPQDAERAQRRALDILTRLVADYPAVPGYRYTLASVQTDLAMFLDTAPGRTRPGALDHPGPLWEAKELLDQAVAIFKQLADQGANRREYRDSLARSQNRLADILRDAGQHADAEAAYRQTLVVRKRLVAAYPMESEYRRGLAVTLNNLGILLKNDDRNPARAREAEDLYGQALAIHRQLVADFPGVPDHENEVAGEMVNLARLLMIRKDFAGARQLLDEAFPHHQTALKATPEHPHYLRFYRNNRWRLSQTLLELKDHTEAAKAVDQFLATAVEPARDAYTAAGLLAGCAKLAAEDDQLPEGKRKELATAYGDRAVAALRLAIDKDAKEVAQMKIDSSLEPLRHRPDFQKLLAEVKFKAPKSGPAPNQK